jgi:exodeoxyribonuclease VII large subunit
MPDAVLTNAPEITVTELSQELRRTVEDRFGYVRVRGEISGFRGRHTSGHAYFCLKDEGARIDAVVWRNSFAKLKFKPEEGMEVIATGRLTTYPGKSAYQIVIDVLEPAGVGALLAQLEERRKRLAAEGLFDEARKRPLPFLPEVIGVVTSPTGAVIRDILHRLDERFPRRVLVWPVRVQGETAAAEVAAAIRGFNAIAPGGSIPRPDVLIVARGGGSLEDLWSFNEEIVVRAAAESAIPLISAVGHETDTTLIDFASDRRAPTPTAAAEIAVPVRADLMAATAERGGRLRAAIARGVEVRRTELRSAARALPRLEALVQLPRQRLDHAAARLAPALAAGAARRRATLAGISARLSPLALRNRIALSAERLDALHARLDRAERGFTERRRAKLEAVWTLVRSLSHEGVLERGYALVLGEGGRVIRRAEEVSEGQPLNLLFADGERAAIADGEGASAPPPPEAKARKPRVAKPSAPKSVEPKAPQRDLFG